jgi:hypothetical protein
MADMSETRPDATEGTYNSGSIPKNGPQGEVYGNAGPARDSAVPQPPLPQHWEELMAAHITPTMLPEPRHGEDPAKMIRTCEKVCLQHGKNWWIPTAGRTMQITTRGPPPSTGRQAWRASYPRDGRCYVLLKALRILWITTPILQRGTTLEVRKLTKRCRVDLSLTKRQDKFLRNNVGLIGNAKETITECPVAQFSPTTSYSSKSNTLARLINPKSNLAHSRL